MTSSRTACSAVRSIRASSQIVRDDRRPQTRSGDIDIAKYQGNRARIHLRRQRRRQVTVTHAIEDSLDGSDKLCGTSRSSSSSGAALNFIVGTPGQRPAQRHAQDDLILGLAGDDTLNGHAGNDILVGGPGGQHGHLCRQLQQQQLWQFDRLRGLGSGDWVETNESSGGVTTGSRSRIDDGKQYPACRWGRRRPPMERPLPVR